MGLENREYFRDGSYTANITGWGVDFTPVVKYLIIANVVVFLMQIFVTKSGPRPELPDFESASQATSTDEAKADDTDNPKVDARTKQEQARKYREAMEELMSNPGRRVSIVQQWLELDPVKTIEKGQLWRLVTCAFCHHRYQIWHILFNMLMLYWFGKRLEQMYGSREFLLFYLAAAICSSLAYIGLAYYSGSKVPAIGASGAVMGVMMLYVIFYPNETFLLFCFIPVPLWALLGLYVIFDLHPILLTLSGDEMFTGIAHAGHLGGLAFGFLYWRFGWRIEALFGSESSERPRRRAKPFREPVILCMRKQDDLSERVDAVLKKISEQGKESLSDDERSILNQASEKYRGEKG